MKKEEGKKEKEVISVHKRLMLRGSRNLEDDFNVLIKELK